MTEITLADYVAAPVASKQYQFVGDLTATFNGFTSQLNRMTQGSFLIINEHVSPFCNNAVQALTLKLADGSFLQLDLLEEEIYREADGTSKLITGVLISVNNPDMTLEQMQNMLVGATIEGFTLVASDYSDNLADQSQIVDVTLDNVTLNIDYSEL